MGRKVIVIGAGFTGLAAAYDLAKAGADVEIFEADNTVGGLAGTFELSPGLLIEKFYHHWFTSDNAVLDLIKELGLEDQLKYIASNTALYHKDLIYKLASPMDLMRFKAIPIIDRIRTGLMVLLARRINDWAPLEEMTSEQWIRRIGGEKAYEVMWRPLLHGKFGPEASNVSAVWFWNKLKLRGSSRNDSGAESLVYFNGSFGALIAKWRKILENLNVKFHLDTPVDEILNSDGIVSGVRSKLGISTADIVLATLPLPSFLDVTKGLPASYVEQASKIRFLGNVCIVLRLKHSLSNTYWLNVADPSFPFVGVIEHTNFDSAANYGGEHIAYLSKYLPTSDDFYKMSPKEAFDYAFPHLQRMFPKLTQDWIIDYKVWKAPYSQPIPSLYYSKLIPSLETPIKGLWLSTMAQIYPEDRGTNYAVQYGRDVAKKIAKTL